MNKQIEEITNELVETSSYGTYNAVAEHLYNKGYRKTADVARKIFEEIELLLDTYSSAHCYQGEVFVQKSFDYELEEAIAELRKKYESEGEE